MFTVVAWDIKQYDLQDIMAWECLYDAFYMLRGVRETQEILLYFQRNGTIPSAQSFTAQELFAVDDNQPLSTLVHIFMNILMVIML
jgi:hypothetical protein